MWNQSINGKKFINIINIIIELQSVSTNETHFATLLKNNEVILYEWKNQVLQQIGQSQQIESSFICFSINLSLEFEILLDCYQDKQLYLLRIIDAKMNIVYQSQQQEPKSTKIQSIFNGTTAFIVYAQYFNNYSLLSLFSEQFNNMSSYNAKFVEFSIPIKLDPNIYVLTSTSILMFSISSESTLKLEFTYNYKSCYNLTMINAYNNFQMLSQCDFIYVLCPLSKPVLTLLQGCSNTLTKQYNQNVNQSFRNLHQNNYYTIFQFTDKIQIYYQLESFYEQEHVILNDSQLFLNGFNELFSFNENIFAYKISQPTLQLNFTNQKIATIYEQFNVKCLRIDKMDAFMILFFNIQLLDQNDTNIYVITDVFFNQYQLQQTYNSIINFLNFSGSALQYSLNSDSSSQGFFQITYTKLADLQQTYILAQLVKQSYVTGFFLIGYNNQSLDYNYCYQPNSKSPYECSIKNSSQISINADQLQAAYSGQPTMVIAGLKENSTIYLFKYYYYGQHSIEQSNFTFQEEFSDFLVGYQNIIILFLNKEIQILSLDYTNSFTLNQQQINKLFKNIQFNPIQITMNTQLLSSLLFINNLNEVIIVSIGQNNIPIPISVIQVNFNIKQINLVNQQLILSYICNNNQNICFKVWNYNNLPKYYYSKNMYSLNFDKNIIIQSDNQYFYVTVSNYTVYIYNPSLPQHMSLYYILELTSPIVCTSAIFLMQDNFNSAVLFYNNSFFNLNNFQTFNSSFDGGNPDTYYTTTYPQVIYNYSIVSGINPKSFYQTPNESIAYLSNFTIFQNQKQQLIQLTQDNLILRPINQSSEINSIAIQYPINLIIDRQVSDCQCISPSYCYIDQPSRLQISNNTNNFTLVTSINNQFFAFQNNESIQILNGELTILSNFSYSYLNFNECLISTSNQNYLYSICYNNSTQYWLTFTLNSTGIVTHIDLIQFNQTFSKIQKISSLLDQIFILAMLDSKGQELYWFNSFNSSLQQLSVYKNNKSMCQDFDIGLLQSNSLDFQSNTIILFMTNGFTLYYQMMFVQANSIELSSIVSYQLQFCNQQFGCFLVSQIIFNLLILKTEGHNVILIVSNSNISFIIKIRILIEQILGSPSLASVIQTIPNYNLNNAGYIIYSDGILMQQFQYYFNQYFVGIYQIDNLAELQNPFEPILMLGQFNTTSVQKAMIINKTNPQNIGIILSFFNNSIYSQALSTWNITNIVFTSKKEINVSIFCENVYSYGTYNITFHLPQSFNINFRRWVYILISIIVVLLLVFCIKIRQNTKNLEYLSEVEL